MRLASTALCCALLAACSGDKTSSSGTTPTTGGVGTATGGTGTGTGGTTSTAGFDLMGTAVDFPSGAPVAEGTCVELIDPSPALTGGEPLTLVSSTVGPNGAIDLQGIQTSSTLGLLLSIKDCGTENQTLFTSATGILYTDIRYLSEGDVLSGVTATSFTMAYVNQMQTDAAALGFAGDLVTDGFFFGLITDSSGQPYGGATLTCGDCGDTFYLDDDDTDGLFATGATANTATSAAAQGAAMIPEGPIGQYTVDDGGTNSWDVQLLGSNPASGLIATFTALP